MQGPCCLHHAVQAIYPSHALDISSYLTPSTVCHAESLQQRKDVILLSLKTDQNNFTFCLKWKLYQFPAVFSLFCFSCEVQRSVSENWTLDHCDTDCEETQQKQSGISCHTIDTKEVFAKLPIFALKLRAVRPCNLIQGNHFNLPYLYRGYLTTI